jgi:hypothetical protein
MELLIYTDHITSRLQYIVNTLFGNEVLLTDSKEKFTVCSGVKINYSDEKNKKETNEREGTDKEEWWIRPYGLLSENGIKPQRVDCLEWHGWATFFETGGDIPFDIFSASFYLITRYEEYLPSQPDEYDRYAFACSLAYQEKFLHLPLVNLWVMELEKLLFPGLADQDGGGRQREVSPLNPASRFTFLPTYDIDIAYNYLYQPLWKNILGFYRDLLRADLDKVLERGNVYSGRKKDPFDVYDRLDELHEQYQLHPVYFFLVPARRRGVDKNLSPYTRGMKQLIKRHAGKYTIGIHPSWQSGSTEDCPGTAGAGDSSAHYLPRTSTGDLLEKEIRLLSKISGKKVVSGRQHYIRMKLPGTYRKLAEQGIIHEYSMGYGSINGFRASYTLPFYWYDLLKEQVTELVIHPFCYMDANACFEQKLTVEQAAIELQQFHDIVKRVNGQLITIFHNHFLTEQPQWVTWKNMYEQFLKKNFS